ncbi:hypothetical protein ACSHWB_03055 [Lentzea sp. HUAS TT2]
MITLRDGGVLLAWRDPMGEVYAYRGSFGVALARNAETGVRYEGGKVSR